MTGAKRCGLQEGINEGKQWSVFKQAAVSPNKICDPTIYFVRILVSVAVRIYILTEITEPHVCFEYLIFILVLIWETIVNPVFAD